MSMKGRHHNTTGRRDRTPSVSWVYDLTVTQVRSRRFEVLRCLHFVDVTRVHQTRSWVVSFSISGPFGPFPVNTMLPRRPCKLQKSTWNERTLSEVRKKDKKKRKAQKQWGISA